MQFAGSDLFESAEWVSEIFMIKGEESNERINTLTKRESAKPPGQLSDFHFCQMAVPDLAARQEKIGTTTHIKLLDCPLKESA